MFKAEREEGILCFKYFHLCGIYIHVVIKGALQGPVPVRNNSKKRKVAQSSAERNLVLRIEIVLK